MDLFQKNFKGYIFAVLVYLIDCQNAEKKLKLTDYFKNQCYKIAGLRPEATT